MLQILRQRKRYPDAPPVFIYTDPIIHVPDIPSLFKKYTSFLEHISEEERWDLFYTVAHHVIPQGATFPQRTKNTFSYQTVIPFDIDNTDIARPLEVALVIGKVMECPIEAMTVIVSGGGVHILLNLKEPIKSTQFFEVHRQDYREICEKINQGLNEAGLPGHADPVVFEPARVLRLPGSRNTKRGNIPCQLIQYSPSALEYDLSHLSGLAQAEKENVSPTEVKRKYPVPDFPEIMAECRFMVSAIAEPMSVHEPQAFDALSILAMIPDSSQALVKEQVMNPRGVAQWIFQNATESQSLKRDHDFDKKWAHARKYGGRKCETVHAHWGKCDGCPHFGKIPTPLALKSPTHIGSAANGYWVLNAKGYPLHPHYQDLASIYRSESSYVVTPGERILGFDQIYSEIAPLTLKGWLENKLVPQEPIREMHRNEFVHKIKAMGEIDSDQEERLFIKSIQGKINCSNGVLDVVSGELLSHSSQYGFKYILPYRYEPNQASELFLDWLALITQDRIDLMESILDLMAYVLWPTYDDHLFAYFVGEGANGKSTLLEIIRELVGPINCSSVSLNQLTRNRFAPASLEGKLANISGESSEREMSVSEINQLKELSAGERTQVERKGKDPFDLVNQAKLIFSANKTPRFEESGHALKRRMLVIPFDHTIEKPDSRVGVQLISEIPAIMSMLVTRIQANVKKNGGRFLVYRGGRDAAEAQEKVLTKGNTVIEWANECVESSTEVSEVDYVTTDAAYTHYLDWAGRNGIKMTKNKVWFSKDVTAYVLTNASREKVSTRSMAGKSIRIYNRMRFKS